VYGKGQGGCGSVEISDTMKVTIHEPLVVKANEGRTILYNTSFILTVSASNGSGSYIYNWDPADKVYTHTTNSTETDRLNSDTRFIVTVTDAVTGCTGKDTVDVKVETDIDNILIIYNAISPNGDGLNDVWLIDNIDLFPDNEVMIFNRWGDKIRNLNHYDNTMVSWDGTNRQGKLVPDGTYYYVLKIKDIKSFTGWIQVKSSF
jgi:gliding motility-associated-like protein